MNDLTESNAAYGRAMPADLTRQDAGPGKPVDGDSGGPAARVPSGDGTGPVRAPQRPEPVRADTLLMLGNHRAYETVLRLARETHALIWDAALAIVRTAPPMPLESSDPWCEDDDAYQRRIGVPLPWNSTDCLDPDRLDVIGRGYGLPRARLVRVDVE